jgi:hypothetical protein
LSSSGWDGELNIGDRKCCRVGFDQLSVEVFTVEEVDGIVDTFGYSSLAIAQIME